jgi:hypothetical protein
MQQSAITLAKILTYSGTLPLVASVAISLFPVAGVDSRFIAISYSAIIISFLCGIHWAAALFFSNKCPHYLLVTSNMITLLAWGTVLLAAPPIAALVHIACFLSLLTLDVKLRSAGILPEWFFTLRRNATMIVILCLSAIAVLS